MSKYVIMTDSACDIAQSVLTEWGIDAVKMSYSFENGQGDNDITSKDFYARMRAGEVAKTSAVNPDTFINAFASVLEQGNDILYLAFSSGLSTTCNSACIAAEELADKFPERKIVVVDSLCASAGQGLFVYLVNQKKLAGASLDEAAEYAEQIKLNICHWFTVDDLVYLKRGGRVSPAVAFVGGMLGIKPVMHVDNEGHLVSVDKVRGRKAAIQALAKKLEETALDKENGEIFISHGDCIDDANALADIFAQKLNAKVNIITDIGAVIGAHACPGTLALLCVGKER